MLGFWPCACNPRNGSRPLESARNILSHIVFIPTSIFCTEATALHTRLRSPGCAGAARFGIEHGNRQPAPFSAVRAVRAVRLASIPATRLRKATASSQAWGLAAGMASAWRAAASCRVLSAGPSRP